MTSPELPSFTNYGNYSSSNYGVHTLRFDSPDGTFWFSYDTLVAFYHPSRGLVVHDNIWGPTTGKHLNWISADHARRVSTDEFNKLYAEAYPERRAA